MENHFEGGEIPFDTSMVVDTKTGEEYVYGREGGSVIRSDFILKPNIEDLTFEKTTLNETILEASTETGMKEVISEEVYVEDTFEFIDDKMWTDEYLHFNSFDIGRPSTEDVSSFLGI